MNLEKIRFLINDQEVRELIIDLLEHEQSNLHRVKYSFKNEYDIILKNHINNLKLLDLAKKMNEGEADENI